MTFNPDAAYAHYMSAQMEQISGLADDPHEGEAPRWEVRFCAPGHDDVTIPYYRDESAHMCEALMVQTELGHDTYVTWIKPTP